MDQCFENFEHEEINLCPQEETQAGLSEDNIYYSPTEFIKTMTLPASTVEGFAASATITADLEMEAGKAFQKLKGQVDMNSLTSALIGNPGNKKHQSTLNIFLAGMRAQLLGYSKKMKNVGGTYIVKDRNGRTFLIGTKLAPARMDNFELTTGQGAEDDNGGTGTLISNAIVYEYTGDIPLTVVENPGGG